METAPEQVVIGAPVTGALEKAGFAKYKAPKSSVNYVISGAETQLLHVPLRRSSTILCQPGAMRYLSPGIKPQVQLGQCGVACCGGESLFRVRYTNEEGEEGALVGLGPQFPAQVIPVDLGDYPRLAIKAGSFLAATDLELTIGTERISSDGSPTCSSIGLLIHPLEGSGTVFLSAGGAVMFRELGQGEVLYASANSLVAFQRSCGFSMESVGGGLGMLCCGGEGLFHVKLVGPGLAILQSLSFEGMAKAIGAKAQSQAS